MGREPPHMSVGGLMHSGSTVKKWRCPIIPVKAKFEDGVLKLIIPKKEEKKAVEEHKTILIEG